MNDPFLHEYEFDLRNYCRMLYGTPWDADDLYQETMLKALKAEGKFLLHPSPKALLFRIASNAWIDECRKRKADVGLPDDYLATYVDFDTYSFNVKDSLELLVAAVPPLQVVVILLVDVFEYSSREIADTYRRLFQIGIRTERHLLSGKVHFTFRDPEGNVFTIIAC